MTVSPCMQAILYFNNCHWCWKGLNRYYQPGSLRQRAESEENVDGRRRKQKEQPAMKQIRPVVMSMQVPNARKQTTQLEAPLLIEHRKRKSLTASARAVGMSLGSAELTVHIKPHRHLRLHAREIPHTFSYIETQSIVVQGREQPVASQDHGSVVTPSKRYSTPVSPQRVTAVVPSKFSLLAIAKKEVGQTQPAKIRKRASTLPAKLLRPTAERSRKLRKSSPDPLPSHQTTYHIPPPSKLGPAVQVCLDMYDSQSGLSEDEGEASSTVIIAPPRPPPLQEDRAPPPPPHLPESEPASQVPVQPSETLMTGEVCVVVGERSDDRPKEHHPTKIIIHGEIQADPMRELEFPVVITSVGGEKEEESSVEELPECISESDDEVPFVPERPRGEYSVKINIDSDVPEMVHEPVPPPIPMPVVHPTWDSIDFHVPLEHHVQPTETEKQKEMYVQSAVDWNIVVPREEAAHPVTAVVYTEGTVYTEPAVQPELFAQPEPVNIDLVHSPIELTWSPPSWPEMQSPEPSEQLVSPAYEALVVRKMVCEEESLLPGKRKDADTVNEVDLPLCQVVIHSDPTSPKDTEMSSPLDSPGIIDTDCHY